MKKTGLEKLAAVKVVTQMKRAAPPERYAQGSTLPDRREQRRLDRERGLVPLAVKLDGRLIERLRSMAAERNASMNELVDEVLRKGLGEPA